MYLHHKFLCLILILAVSHSAAATQHPPQALNQIIHAAEEFALRRIQSSDGTQARVQAAHLDPRLRLQACEQALETFSPPGAQPNGRTSVGVRCSGSKPWTLYVPVTIHITRKVWVLNHTMAQGSTIKQSDLTKQAREVSTLTQVYLDDAAEMVGKQLKRAVSRGIALTPGMLAFAQWVKRGQAVTIQSGSGSVQVSANGVAMAQGVKGDRIQVKNTQSGRLIDAKIIAQGVVQGL